MRRRGSVPRGSSGGGHGGILGLSGSRVGRYGSLSRIPDGNFAPCPSPRLMYRSEWALILSLPESGKHMLCAICGPERQQLMIVPAERAAAMLSYKRWSRTINPLVYLTWVRGYVLITTNPKATKSATITAARCKISSAVGTQISRDVKER